MIGLIRGAVAEIERNTQDQQPQTKEAATMSDDNERSVASNGSVAGEPVAWAVLDSRGTVCVAYACREAAEAYCDGTFNRLAPLYRQPQDGVVRLPPLDTNGAPGWNAAIRERDEARALLKLAQVQRTSAYADRDEARAEVYRLKCSMTETSKERDAAIRERDEARAEAQRIQDEADDQEQTDKVKRLNAEIDKIHYTLMNRTWERDEARAEVERLKAELAARQPAAPPEGWPTNEERAQLWFMLNRVRRSGYFAAEDVEAILSRSGPPPVVEVPDMSPATYGFDSPFSNGQYRAGYRQACLMHRAALDKAGVAWKEVGRE